MFIGFAYNLEGDIERGVPGKCHFPALELRCRYFHAVAQLSFSYFGHRDIWFLENALGYYIQDRMISAVTPSPQITLPEVRRDLRYWVS
jgi:hypothetical protein